MNATLSLRQAASYGKMRPQAQRQNKHLYYRCRARELGYSCEQSGVGVKIVDEQVIQILKNLRLPVHWKENITKSIGDVLGEQNLDQRLNEIHTMIEPMDMRWDHGFITDEQTFFEQRLKLQQELEKLTPVADDELQQAADLLSNFNDYWERCGNDIESQSRLIRQIVERVYVHDKQIAAMTLHSNCHLVLGHNTNGPTEYTIDPFISGNKSASTVYRCGDDELRSLTGTQVLLFLPRHIARRCFSNSDSADE